jgi:hypothetical protein
VIAFGLQHPELGREYVVVAAELRSESDASEALVAKVQAQILAALALKVDEVMKATRSSTWPWLTLTSSSSGSIPLASTACTVSSCVACSSSSSSCSMSYFFRALTGLW